MQQFIVEGLYKMVVEAATMAEAKRTSEQILRNDGIKAVAVEATENSRRGRK